MSDLVRFTVSLEGDLLARFDRYCEERKFATRSEAVRQLLHQTLAQDEWTKDAEDVSATLTLVYDHHRTQLIEQLLQLQHKYPERVVSSMHVHLDHDCCMEVIILRGRASVLQQFAAELRGLKGIHQGTLVLVGVHAAGGEQHGHSHGHGHD